MLTLLIVKKHFTCGINDIKVINKHYWENYAQKINIFVSNLESFIENL